MIIAMEKILNSCFVFIFILNLVFGFDQVHAVPYDYSYTQECLAKPLRPQYDGGLVVNPELNEGLRGWTTFGDAKIEHGKSYDGNKYIVASKRNQSSHGFSQTFNLESNKLYTFSAWLQVSDGSADIGAILKTETSNETAGWITAQNGCWSMLKGGLVVNVSGLAQLYFESKNPEVDIWADSISLQPFTQEEWKSHQQQSVEKVRKSAVTFHAADQHGRPIRNATVSITQRRGNFPFGCAINQNILHNAAYQNWFSSRFKFTVFENELKWYSTEGSRGAENYGTADALVQFARSRGVAVRGHNVFWDDPKFQPGWVSGLSFNDLRAAAFHRVNSVVGRYRGQLIHWDVVNENLHFNLFESRLGGAASAGFYGQANRIDGSATPFLNDYNTIEGPASDAANPGNYLAKIRGLRSQGYNGPLGIGAEGHFPSNVNLAYTRSAVDVLASARLSIWVTELDVASGPNQASNLDQLLQELHAHPAVQGIIIWSAWSPQGCYRMCLTDNNFRNLVTGDVVDRLRNQWRFADAGFTDSDGVYHASLYHGDYEVKISHPNGDVFSDLRQISVVPNEEGDDIHRFTINV